MVDGSVSPPPAARGACAACGYSALGVQMPPENARRFSFIFLHVHGLQHGQRFCAVLCGMQMDVIWVWKYQFNHYYVKNAHHTPSPPYE